MNRKLRGFTKERALVIPSKSFRRRDCAFLVEPPIIGAGGVFHSIQSTSSCVMTYRITVGHLRGRIWINGMSVRRKSVVLALTITGRPVGASQRRSSLLP